MTADSGGGSPNRKCVITGRILPPAQMIRFVASDSGEVLPDIKAYLPGRGAWVVAERAILEKTFADKQGNAKPLLASLKAKHLTPDMLGLIEQLLLARVQSQLSMGRKAGVVIGGGGAIKAYAGASAKKGNSVDWLIVAVDASEREAKAMLATTKPNHQCRALTSGEIGAVFGRESLVFAACLVSPNQGFSHGLNQSIGRALLRLQATRL